MTTVFIALVFVVDAHRVVYYVLLSEVQEPGDLSRSRGYVGSIYICKDCGYRGSFVLEVDSPDAIKNVEKENRDHK